MNTLNPSISLCADTQLNQEPELFTSCVLEQRSGVNVSVTHSTKFIYEKSLLNSDPNLNLEHIKYVNCINCQFSSLAVLFIIR